MKDELKTLERKIDLLLRRRQNQEGAERRRRNARVSELGNQIKQLKVEKIALLNYIRELEGILKVNDPMKLPKKGSR